MEQLVLCQVCHRHVKSADVACPFCRSAMTRRRDAALRAAGAVTFGLALSFAACGEGCAAYGLPPPGGGGTGGTGGAAGGDTGGTGGGS